MSTVVAGVDGCRHGWICVVRHLDPPFQERAFCVPQIEVLLQMACSPAVIAIDIPIGIPESGSLGGRECDIAARAKLEKRGRTVFAVPARAALAKRNYDAACAAAFANSDPPRQISRQMFYLFPKTRELDNLMTPLLQKRIYECHPEVAFWAMSGGHPLNEPKKFRGRKHESGLKLRRDLLRAQGFSRAFLDETKFPRSEAATDDFFDACACAWTAARIYKGEAIRFPSHPPLDPKGLHMEILA